MAGRAPLYGLCAYGERGVEHALAILKREAEDSLGLLEATSPSALGRQFPGSGFAPAGRGSLEDRATGIHALSEDPSAGSSPR